MLGNKVLDRDGEISAYMCYITDIIKSTSASVVGLV